MADSAAKAAMKKRSAAKKAAAQSSKPKARVDSSVRGYGSEKRK